MKKKIEKWDGKIDANLLLFVVNTLLIMTAFLSRL